MQTAVPTPSPPVCRGEEEEEEEEEEAVVAAVAEEEENCVIKDPQRWGLGYGV